MITIGGQLADAWVREFPQADIQFPSYRLTDRDHYRSLLFGPNNVSADIEGEKDFEIVAKFFQRIAIQFAEEAAPPSLNRVGLRYVLMLPGEDRQVVLNKTVSSFFASGRPLVEKMGRDKVSDLAIVLDYNADVTSQGRVAFGPFVPEANLVSFSYQSHPALAEIKNGYIYDCDFATVNPPVSLLKSKEFLEWIYGAYAASRDRVRAIHAIAFEGE